MLAALATCSTPAPGLLQTTKVILAFVAFSPCLLPSTFILPFGWLNFWMIFSALLPAPLAKIATLIISLFFFPERRAQTFARYFLKNENCPNRTLINKTQRGQSKVTIIIYKIT